MDASELGTRVNEEAAIPSGPGSSVLRRPVILDRTKHFPFVLMRFHSTISAVTQVCQVSYGARGQSTAQCEATRDVRMLLQVPMHSSGHCRLAFSCRS